MKSLPSAEYETTKGGEEKAGLQARVQEINSLETIFDVDRNSVIDQPEGRDSRKVLTPPNTGVDIHHGERLLIQTRQNLLLQVLFQCLNGHMFR